MYAARSSSPAIMRNKVAWQLGRTWPARRKLKKKRSGLFGPKVAAFRDSLRATKQASKCVTRHTTDTTPPRGVMGNS